MKNSDLLKLEVGQRVIIKGNQDGERFANEKGEVLEVDKHDDSVKVRLDEHDGQKGYTWWFFCENAHDFNIKVEKPKKKRPHGAQEYKGNGKHAWELVAAKDQFGGDTYRLRVPGGWLYSYESQSAHGLTFVPVPEAVGYAV